MVHIRPITHWNLMEQRGSTSQYLLNFAGKLFCLSLRELNFML